MADERVVHTDSSGTNMVLVAILVIAVLLFLYFGTGLFRGNTPATQQIPDTQSESTGGESEGGDVNFEIPDEIDVDVDVDQPAQE